MKELIENMDNWTLVKLIGGMTIILSSVISFVAYFIKDYYINKWKSNYQIDIEKIKGNLSQNNSILDNLTKSISNIYLASNEKRIEYLEKVWNGMMEQKRGLPSVIFMAYTILTKEEIEKLPQTTNEYTIAGIKSFKPKEYFDFHLNITSELEKTRPFIGEKIWLIYFVYQAFLGRLTYLIQDGLEKGKVKYWKDDKGFINQILLSVIKKDELNKLIEKDISSFHNILNFLEFKALNDISEQLSGKRMTEESVEQALKLSNLTKNTVA